jgi:hypothetical protein
MTARSMATLILSLRAIYNSQRLCGLSLCYKLVIRYSNLDLSKQEHRPGNSRTGVRGLLCSMPTFRGAAVVGALTRNLVDSVLDSIGDRSDNATKSSKEQGILAWFQTLLIQRLLTASLQWWRGWRSCCARAQFRTSGG